MKTIELLDEAKEDIVDGGFFYRQQGGDALKDYFVDSIFASIDRLSYRPRQLLQYIGETWARHFVGEYPPATAAAKRSLDIMVRRRNGAWHAVDETGAPKGNLIIRQATVPCK